VSTTKSGGVSTSWVGVLNASYPRLPGGNYSRHGGTAFATRSTLLKCDHAGPTRSGPPAAVECAQMDLPRSKRVFLDVPVAYRTAGDEMWLQGRIVNVSESGIMFAPAVVEIGQSIEMIFSTPIAIASIAPGRLICKAKVVRTGVTGAAAVRFEEYRFLLEQ
jgi:hypothetical protein